VTLTIRAKDFDLRTGDGDHPGQIVVNRDEIDFYSSTGCDFPAPEGIGHYRWTIVGGTLTFHPLKQDPCPRGGILQQAKFKRGP
jgi:hypothetical protein